MKLESIGPRRTGALCRSTSPVTPETTSESTAKPAATLQGAEKPPFELPQQTRLTHERRTGARGPRAQVALNLSKADLTALAKLRALLPQEMSQSPFLVGVWDKTPRWLLSRFAGQALLASPEGSLPESQLIAEMGERARAHRSGEDPGAVKEALEALVAAGIVTRSDGRYQLAVDRDVAALRVEDIGYFQTALTTALADGDAAARVRPLLLRWARRVEELPLYVNEAQWPILKAAAGLDRKALQKLVEIIEADPDLRAQPLSDAIALMARGTASPRWLERFASELAGRTVYSAAAEGVFAAGGLGRVQQYHTQGMKQLGAEVVTIEPYYGFTRGPDGQPQAIDYRSLPIALPDLAKEPTYSFDVTVGGKPVRAEVFVTESADGIRRVLIRDSANYVTRQVYAYGVNGSASWEEFSELMSRASLEAIRRLEESKRQARGTAYRPPLFIANDAQLALMPYYLRGLQRGGVLGGTLAHMITHTHKNRVTMNEADGAAMLRRMGVGDEDFGYFRRIGELDVTSGGIRLADTASGVSALHRDRVAHIDPQKVIAAITNGVVHTASNQVYRSIFAKLFGDAADHVRPSPAQVGDAKRAAKQRLGLDPDQMVASYSGRMVSEKVARQRSLTDANIEAMMRLGVQVVIYGNVQASSSESREMYDKLVALAQKLNGRQELPGKLVVRTGWGTPEQSELLAATDVQILDSDYGTGAAEYSETNITGSAGLVLAPPWLEGTIQEQGRPIDRSRPGIGNTLVPGSDAPADYLEAIGWASEAFKKGTLLEWEAKAPSSSMPLSHLVTASAYLRYLARGARQLAASQARKAS